MKKYIVLTFFMVFLSAAVAQDYFDFRSYHRLNSFPYTDFYEITQDDYGYIWLADKRGLTKFDGSKFEPVRIPVNDGRTFPAEVFECIQKDQHGDIWAGTFSGGLYRIDVSKNKAFFYAASKTQKNTLRDSRIIKIFEDPEGQVWIACFQEGFCRYRPETDDFECYKPSVLLQQQSEEGFLDNVLSFHYQGDALWMGTRSGLLRFDPKTETLEKINFAHQQESPKAISMAFSGVKTMVALNEQEILVLPFSEAEELFVYHIFTQKTKLISLPPSNKKSEATSLFKNGETVYYVAGEKIGRINTKDWTTKWMYNTSEFSNIDFTVEHFFRTDSGQLWAYSLKNLYQVNLPDFDKKSIGLSGYSQSAIQLNEEALLFLEEGNKTLGKYDLKTSEVSRFQYRLNGLAKNNAQIKELFKAEDGTIYGNSDGNVYRLNQEQNSFDLIWDDPKYFNQNSSEAIYGSFLDRQGNYWLGTRNNGILRIDLSTKETLNYKNIPEKGIHPIVYNGYSRGFYQKDNRLWYGTQMGFGYYDYLQDKFTNFYFSDYSTDDPAFPMKGIARIREDQFNRVWLVEKHHGLAYFDLDEKTPQLKVISQKDGLWDDHVEYIEVDVNGDIWVSHWKGVSRIRADDLTIENFGFESGFIFNSRFIPFLDGGMGLLYKGHLQKIWPDKIQEIKIDPTITIKDFKVFDHSLDLNNGWNEINSVDLSYDQNFFSIYFDAINFRNNDVQEIQYKLEGLQEEWINTSNRDYVSFASVKGGNYQFKLRARIKGQEWTTPKILKLHIATPYWKTTWFYVLLTLLLMGLIYTIYSYRIRKIKEQEALKSQFKTQLAEVEMTALRAQMNPHFLFNCLNSIKLFIVEKDTLVASDYLTKFSKLIRLILQNSKSKMIPLANELETLELYIDLEKMRFDDQFEYQIVVDPKLDLAHLKIPPLLIQPYVENAIWHGLVHPDRLNKLSISLTQAEGKLRCIIEDNGIGRIAAEKRKSNRNTYKKSLGATITKDRIDLTRELYQIETSIDFVDLLDADGEAAGTRVVLTIPLLV